MAFLTPLFLLGMLAVAIPIAIHFIRRDKPPVVAFSSLRFFQPRSRKQFLFQRFQQWLLLLLRALVVVLLALAFARPFFSQTFSGLAEMAPRSAVVAMDVSMSMAYEDHLERAKTRAQTILDQLGPGDEAALVLFDSEVREVHGPTTDLDSLSAVIDNLSQTTYGSTRFFPVLRLGDELLSDARFEDRTVYLISDFQETGMSQFDDQWLLAPGVNFSGEKVGDEATDNLAITGVKAPTTLRGVAETQSIQARVRSTGSVARDTAELTVSVNQQEQINQTLDLSDQSEVVVPLELTLTDQTHQVVSLELEGDGFPADNRHYITLGVLPKLRVLLVNGDPSSDWLDDESHWFHLALTGDSQSPFAVTVVDAQNFTPDQLTEQDLAVFLNLREFTSAQADALARFVENGGGALLAPGDRAQADNYNRQLAPLSPAEFVAPELPGGGDYLLIADVAHRHPIFRPLEVDWTARFSGHWWLDALDEAEVLMGFDNGRPALLERAVGEGRVLLFASSLDMAWNNLPLQGMYLPFIHEMLKYLGATPEKQLAYTVGDAVSLPEGRWQITGPAGDSPALQDGRLTLTGPGVYRAEAEDGTAQVYAVNPPMEESALVTLAPGDLLDQVLNPETTPAQSAEVRSALMKQELERPQRLWWWLLAAVTLLLLGETLLANRTYR